MADPIFLDFGVIEILHQNLLEHFGGATGIRDKNLIESALASAQNVHHYGGGDLFDIAAAYAFHLAQAQAYLDGNKRTGAGAALLFLRANGIRSVLEDDQMYEAMIAIAEGRLDRQGLAHLLRSAALSAS